MKTICRAIFILLSIFVFSQSLRAATLARSMSPSRQFIIYGGDATLRGAVSKLAEQTKTNLLALLRQPDGWKTPIVVNLQSAQANLQDIPADALKFSQACFGEKLKFDVIIGEEEYATMVVG